MKNSSRLTKTSSQPVFIKPSLEDLSIYTQNQSLQISSPSQKNYSQKQKTQTTQNQYENHKPQLVEMKFRMFLNLFNQDHYIFKLDLPSNTKIQELETYFLTCQTFKQIKKKSLQTFVELQNLVHKDQKDFYASCTFTYQKKKIQNNLTIYQLNQLIRKSMQKENLIDLSYHWKPKFQAKQKVVQKITEQKQPKQNKQFCSIM